MNVYVCIIYMYISNATNIYIYIYIYIGCIANMVNLNIRTVNVAQR